MKHGFEAGLVVGFLGWLYLNGYIASAPAPTMAKVLVTLFAVAVFLLAVLLTVASIGRRKAVFSTTVDGFIYGVAAAYDISYIIHQMYLGQLPLP